MTTIDEKAFEYALNATKLAALAELPENKALIRKLFETYELAKQPEKASLIEKVEQALASKALSHRIESNGHVWLAKEELFDLIRNYEPTRRDALPGDVVERAESALMAALAKHGEHKQDDENGVTIIFDYGAIVREVLAAIGTAPIQPATELNLSGNLERVANLLLWELLQVHGHYASHPKIGMNALHLRAAKTIRHAEAVLGVDITELLPPNVELIATMQEPKP